MADVIVKGVEMPKACGCCCFCTMESDGDECAINCAIVTEYQKRPKDCPLRPTPEWSSVEQLQPPTDTAILLLINREFQVVARLRKGEWVLSWNFEPLDLDSTDVLHWMPLQESSIRSDEDGN